MRKNSTICVKEPKLLTMNYEWYYCEYMMSTDKRRLDVRMIHRFLAEESYWARGRSLETVLRAIEHSVCLGLYQQLEDQQIGFARAITDFATYAYLADVFILAPYRGRGLGKWLVQTMLVHPELKGVPNWALKTANAHGLYVRYGFDALALPEQMMELQRTCRGKL